MTSLTSFLFPEYRRRVLGLLLLHPEASYHVREIARLTGTRAESLHRELSMLAKFQVLLREKSGNLVQYKANSEFPIFNELASILRKTSGLIEVLANALLPLKDKIEAAFVFGSVGRGTENARSDIDVLLIGDLGFAEAVAALFPVQAILGREINPKVYNRNEWQLLKNQKNAFVQDILNNQKLFIVGAASDLE